jgi:lon-related putative ATP-dependent protease
MIMNKHKELSKEELEVAFHSLPKFSTTMEIAPYKSIIGQNRAEKSIDLGLQIPKKGYNIFVTGHSGTGKTGYLIKKIEEYAKDLTPSKDWCYVYNFKSPIKPIALDFEPNTAKDFKESLSELIDDLIKEVPTIFNDKEFEKQKNSIISKYEKLIIKESDKLDEDAKNMNFIIKQNPAEGFVFIPLNDGKEMDSEAYNLLGEVAKDQITESANELRLMSLEVIKETKTYEKQMELELQELDDKIANTIISDRISILKNKFGSSDKINDYLDEFKADIVKYIEFFVTINEDSENKNPELDKAFLSRYDINIIVNNSECKGAPVIFEDSPEHNNLFGKIEYENRGGNVVTDFTMIRPGTLHTANDGFIIMNAYQLLTNAHSWQVLKRCIKSEYITIENSRENLELFPTNTLKPENIPFKAKIILIGDEYTYSLLSSGDPDFNKLFKIKAEFDSVIENNSVNTNNLIGFVSDYILKNELLHMTQDGVKELLRYSIRLSENLKYFASSMSKLAEVMDLANIFATNSTSKYITAEHIESAINEIDEMHGLIKKKILDMYINKKYIVDFKGAKVGQINGLSVLDYGDCVVGQQHRITVATYAGKEGIIDIERETDMSGSIHSKGIMILAGFIGHLLGQDTSLSFNASIVFEQLYSGIEGDSASAAELIALISSLSDMPIKQSYAITGSVNQRGEIQPIGGAIHKIEGYFNICSIFGLDGTHGVIIPETNVDELVLNKAVLEAVEKGLFHIYPVKSIEECIDILCEDEFKKDLTLPLMSVLKHKIFEKLNKFNNVLNKH